MYKKFICRIGQISLANGPLATLGTDGKKYIDLFVSSLRNYGMLCIGLYRSLSIIKHDNIEFELFSIACSTGQYFPVFEYCIIYTQLS